MKKLLITSVALALASSAWTQDGSKPITHGEDALKVTVSGGLDLDYVMRSGELVERRTEGLSGGTVASDDADTFEGTASVRLDIEGDNNISAALEVSNQRLDGTGDGTATTWGSDAESSGAFISEASVTMKGLWTESMDVTFGVVQPSYNIRGNGGSALFDPRWSDDLSTTDSAATNLPQGIDEGQPTGAVVHYTRDAMDWNFWLLPAVDEGGSPSADESVYGAGLYYKLSQFAEGSRVGAVLLLFNDAGSNYNVRTLGGGATIHGLGDQPLEVYAEVYMQTGDAGTTGTGATIDAEGRLIQFGGKYNLSGDNSPWVEGKFTSYSGDDTAGDDEEGNFLSYENQNDLIVLEGQNYGINVRSNYTALKALGGLKLSSGGQTNNIELTAAIGSVEANEDITAAAGDDLGNEIDVALKFNLSKSASATVALGYVTGADAIETLTTDGTTDSGDDTLWAFVLGLDVRF